MRKHGMVSIALAFLLSAASLGGAAAAPTMPGLTPVPYVNGLSQPTDIARGIPGDRVLVAEQRGTIRVVTNAQLQPRPFLDVRRAVLNSGEQGLLGVAVSPRFSRDRFVVFTYVGLNSDLVLARVKSNRLGTAAIPGSMRIVLRVPHRDYTNHNGGSLAFDSRGLLYWGTGDGGGGGDTLRVAQRLTSPLGKVLRINPLRNCGRRPYCVPKNTYWRNPSPIARLVWARGLRNPWKMSADLATGRLWIADVGQSEYEEINAAPFGAKALNFGWSCQEGTVGFNGDQCRPGLRAPVATLCHEGSVPGCASPLAGQSITGGHVYRGRGNAALRGTYVFGDFIAGRIFGFRGGRVEHLASVPLISTFGMTASGELLVASYGSGTIYRLS